LNGGVQFVSLFIYISVLGIKSDSLSGPRLA